ncbi:MULTISPECIES: hypothetical protein [Myroides]|uniref:PAP2 superfamily protein n=1 Tax=Myroides albus TaxID=2562892 RepID=A0A6I3LI81_9FLAO|nr:MULTISPECIES: hypothetical protein [Myroides]MTG96870.1 hypothetical protein [Myroides albus]MVX36506.1 hypothetical protein [Myroides sp. LoEW2-1]UVD78380.1 hypothetical protein NWE55_09555 [Myroides albus]
MEKTLKILSYLFHPIVIPLFTVLLYFYFTSDFFNSTEILIISIQVGIITILLPITIYLLLHSLKLISSTVMLNNPRERLLPFFVNIILLISLKDYILMENSAYELKLYFWGLICTYTLLLLFLFVKQKCSTHMALFSSMITFTVYLLVQYQIQGHILLIAMVMLLGGIGSARLYLKAHTSLEVILGTIIGILPQFFFIYNAKIFTL